MSEYSVSTETGIEHVVVGPDPGDRIVKPWPEALLFLHGLGGDWTNWLPQLDHFGRRHRCISWTMPGYGESEPIDPMNWSGLAAAAVRLLDRYAIGRATIVGLSMGGMVAQQFAVDHPDRVERMVLAGTSLSFGRPGSDFAEKYLAMRYGPLDAGQTPADLAPSIADGLLGSSPAEGARANAIASMSRITDPAYRRALECLVTWDFADQAKRIEVKAMCVAGDEDQTAPFSSAERLAKAIPWAELAKVEACGHLINLEQPEAFNQLVEYTIAR
ncbi:MAG: alpha/beta fold hydrolase [Actinomycetota bacterium]